MYQTVDVIMAAMNLKAVVVGFSAVCLLVMVWFTCVCRQTLLFIHCIHFLSYLQNLVSAPV